jgi:uncharacterized membrane protein YkoI
MGQFRIPEKQRKGYMMRTWIGLFVGLAAVLTCFGALGGEENDDNEKGEVAVDWQGIPQAARDAILKELGAKPSGIEVKGKDGFIAYEAELETKDGEREVTVAEDGSLITSEEKIDAGALPPEVLARVKSLHFGAEIKEAERVVVIYYEVEVESNGKEHEVRLLANGQTVPIRD